jgi:hypothetical protein
MNESSNTSKEPQKNYTLQLIACWLVVGIPLAWGVYRTFLTTLELFK